MKKLLIPVIVLIGLSSCSNYYKAITTSEATKPGNLNFQDNQKYYILRNGSEAFAMKNISMSSDRKNLQCILEELPFDHKLYVTNGTTGKMKYKTKKLTEEDESGILNEVHIYVTAVSKTEPGAYTLAFENIQKAEIIEKDKAKTQRSHALGLTLGITVPIVIVGGAFGIAIASYIGL